MIEDEPKRYLPSLRPAEPRTAIKLAEMGHPFLAFALTLAWLIIGAAPAIGIVLALVFHR